MELTAAAARPRPRVDRTFLGVLLCFVLSGFAALLYQTAWMRQFSVVFGTSELAVATVLAAYMAGLAAGAALASRLVHRVRRPVLVYGLLELGIAGGALLVPFGLRVARVLAAAALGGSADLVAAGGVDQTLFFLAGAFVVVMIPTALMGATLPLLTRHAVRRREQIGPRVGLLYAFNTGGAVLGTLAAAFWLLPELGLTGTVLVGVATNVIVFAIAAALAHGANPAPVGSAPPIGVPITGEAGIEDRRARWILPLILASGAVSFMYEVLWTRLLAHVLGGSVQAFATMLAAFLTGITLGGALAAAAARGRRSSALGFILAQVGIAGLSLYVFLFLDRLPRGIQELSESYALDAPWARVLGGVLVLLPAAVCIGMTFPFALRVLAREEEQAGPASARVYAWNTVGAIAGALLAGFVVVPGLGFAETLRLAVCANLLLALAAALLFLPSWRVLTAALAIGLGLGAVFRPGEPERLLAHAVLDPGGEPGRVLSTAVGRSATVMLLERPDGDGFELRSNGLPEANIDAQGVPPFGRGAERWLTLLPVLARPSSRTMLVVGFGGGVALEELPPTLLEVDVVELEPEIIAANRLVAGERRKDPFAAAELSVVINDARGALELTDHTWDVIVSQPSHPWTAGASHLYTREFLALCREHMKSDGVLVQWINAGFLDEALLSSVGATLLDAFPHVRLYRPIPSMLVFLASQAPLEPERELVATGQPLVGQPEFWNRLGLFGVSDVAMLLAMEQAGLEEMCRDAPVITDDANLLAMRAGPELKRRFDPARLWTVISRGEPLEDEAFLREVGPHLDRPYMARRMMYTVPNRAVHSSNILVDPGEKKLAQGLARGSWQMGDFGGAAQDLQEALRADPADPQARFALLRNDLPRIARGEPGTEALAGLSAGLTGSAGAVVVGWRHAVRGDWAALERLEGPLAEARPVVAWYLEAVRLRVLWRLRGGAPRAEEALAMIDAALHLEPDPALVALRLEAATALDLPHHVLHTTRELLRFLAPRLGALPPALEEELAAGLRAVEPRLEALALDERLDGEAVRRLRAELDEVLARLPAPAGDGSTEQAFR